MGRRQRRMALKEKIFGDYMKIFVPNKKSV
jgi:hypothetical protein